jgi:RimJ/RimL family protein N-acetyltransferase
MIKITLGDTDVMLRWATPMDGELLATSFKRLSAESRRMRFFTAMPRLPESVMNSLLSIDPPRHFAVIAFEAAKLDTTAHSWFDAAIGVARLIAMREHPGSSEFAMTVVDGFQHHGLGHLMFEALLVTADRVGVQTIEADVLTENAAMTALLHHYRSKASHPTNDYTTTHMCVSVQPNLDDIEPQRRAALEELVRHDPRLVPPNPNANPNANSNANSDGD